MLDETVSKNFAQRNKWQSIEEKEKDLEYW